MSAAVDDPCDQCGEPASSKCGGCRQRSYCGRECQSIAWRTGHKAECRRLQEEEAVIKAGRIVAALSDEEKAVQVLVHVAADRGKSMAERVQALDMVGRRHAAFIRVGGCGLVLDTLEEDMGHWELYKTGRLPAGPRTHHLGHHALKALLIHEYRAKRADRDAATAWMAEPRHGGPNWQAFGVLLRHANFLQRIAARAGNETPAGHAWLELWRLFSQMFAHRDAAAGALETLAEDGATQDKVLCTMLGLAMRKDRNPANIEGLINQAVAMLGLQARAIGPRVGAARKAVQAADGSGEASPASIAFSEVEPLVCNLARMDGQHRLLYQMGAVPAAREMIAAGGVPEDTRPAGFDYPGTPPM